MSRSTTKRFIPAVLVAVVLVFVLMPVSNALSDWWTATEVEEVVVEQPWHAVHVTGVETLCESVTWDNGMFLIEGCEGEDGKLFNAYVKYQHMNGAYQDID